jgi:TM2 domain-containing membrane protein YozV
MAAAVSPNKNSIVPSEPSAPVAPEAPSAPEAPEASSTPPAEPSAESFKETLNAKQADRNKAKEEERTKKAENAQIAKEAEELDERIHKKRPTAVSDLKFWREGDDINNANAATSAASLSYTTFTVLSVLGGFLALDHLYLRSPMTFVAKLVVNLLFFGVWWIWDACQAVFNEPVVRIYGLPMPGYTVKGIAGGVLADEQPSKKHLQFFTYALALFFGGIIGLDSFLVGEKRMGLFRLVCTVSVILMPISLVIWGLKVSDFFFFTKETVDMYATYFGGNGAGSMGGLFQQMLYNIIKPLIGPFEEGIIKPVTTSIDGVVGVVDKTLDAGTEIIGAVKSIADAAQNVTKVLPATSLYSAVTTPALQEAIQKGGATENSIKLLPYTLVGTVALLISTGIYTNFKKKHVAKDDSPPKP